MNSAAYYGGPQGGPRRFSGWQEKKQVKTVKSEVSKKKVTERKWENISLKAFDMPLNK